MPENVSTLKDSSSLAVEHRSYEPGVVGSIPTWSILHRSSARSVMVIIGASQALDPGSIPGERTRLRIFGGISSIGRVRALQARGTGIETPMLHFALRAGARDVFVVSAFPAVASLDGRAV